MKLAFLIVTLIFSAIADANKIISLKTALFFDVAVGETVPDASSYGKETKLGKHFQLLIHEANRLLSDAGYNLNVTTNATQWATMIAHSTREYWDEVMILVRDPFDHASWKAVKANVTLILVGHSAFSKENVAEMHSSPCNQSIVSVSLINAVNGSQLLPDNIIVNRIIRGLLSSFGMDPACIPDTKMDSLPQCAIDFDRTGGSVCANKSSHLITAIAVIAAVVAIALLVVLFWCLCFRGKRQHSEQQSLMLPAQEDISLRSSMPSLTGT